MKQTLRHIGLAAIVVAWSALAGGQVTGKPVAPPSAAPATAPPPSEPYNYDPVGRRDPFVSLVARGVQPTTGTHPAGLSGLSTAEVVLTSVGA